MTLYGTDHLLLLLLFLNINWEKFKDIVRTAVTVTQSAMRPTNSSNISIKIYFVVVKKLRLILVVIIYHHIFLII